MTCVLAVRDIARLSNFQNPILSRWYESAPVPPSGQAPYVNGVLRLEGNTDPASLLHALQAIEDAHGRTRSVPNAARTLDLDIVAMDGIVRTSPDPVLPHPRMHERAFVLMPLMDVAPGWVHPILGQAAAALLDRLPPQNVHPLPPLRDGGLAPN